jgi:hypothetical protein
VYRIEFGGPGDFQSAMNRAELLDRVGERFDQQGRAMFERFIISQLDKLRQEQQAGDD